VDNRQDPTEEDLVSGTIQEIAVRLLPDELKLTDYLRLLQLTDEIEEDETTQLKAGWVSTWRTSSRNKEE
jgi:hypothetical protein